MNQHKTKTMNPPNEHADELIKKTTDELINNFTPEQQGEILKCICESISFHYSNTISNLKDEIDRTDEMHSIYKKNLVRE